MDDFIIFENGVIRITARQLCNLWLDCYDSLGVMDLIDIKQPESFTDKLDWSIFARSSDLEK